MGHSSKVKACCWLVGSTPGIDPGHSNFGASPVACESPQVDNNMLRIIVLFLLAFNVQASGTALKTGPDMLMLEGDEGDTVVTEITLANPDRHPVPVRLETTNWALDEDGRRIFGVEEAQHDDCSAWWSEGFADLLIQPGAAIKHPVSIRIPEDLPGESECRFALVIKTSEEGEHTNDRFIPVYLNVDGAEPEIELKGLVIKKTEEGRSPMIMVRNSGTAHARVFGMFEGEDAQGQELELVVRSTEILAGETRGLPLLVSKRGGGQVWWSAPVSMSGRLIWEDGDMDFGGILQ